jgi:hypothetical protein
MRKESKRRRKHKRRNNIRGIGDIGIEGIKEIVVTTGLMRLVNALGVKDFLFDAMTRGKVNEEDKKD